MNYAKYGLTKTNASASDHEKGVVRGPDGNYYQIDNFKREQKKDIDTDQGDVFSSSLYEDSGADFTNFNTATDVENALKLMDDDGGDSGETTEVPIELSPRLAHARARVAQYQEDLTSGQAVKDLYDSADGGAQGFLDRYKLKLGEKLANGYYADPDGATNTVNSSKVASGENDVSVDAAEFAKTGKDNRKDY